MKQFAAAGTLVNPTQTVPVFGREPVLLSREAWPAFTTHTSTDVVVAALSMTRLVDWCGTPCVHTADALDPDGSERPSETELASVVMVTVLAVEWRSDFRLHVTIDADLRGCSPTMAETRLVGRQSTVAPASVTIESASADPAGFSTLLPADVTSGDLLALPCRGVTLLHDIRTGCHPVVGAATGIDTAPHCHR